MLTAAGAVESRLAGLGAGADDYLPKPFEPRELLARVRGVLRRLEAPTEPAGKPAGCCLSAAAVLDLDARRLLDGDGAETCR